MKPKFLLSRVCVIVILLLAFVNQAMASGNLRIIASGSSSAPPLNNWVNGIGIKGQTYTITASDLTSLLTLYAYNLTLNYDTIEISGEVILNCSNATTDVHLSLRANDYADGVISFDNNASMELIAGNTHASVLSFAAGNMHNMIDLKADTIKISDITQGFTRIEMNGFKNWIQEDIDSLISRASHIGNSITDTSTGGYKSNDFTYNTIYEADSGVFSMTAQSDFLIGKGIGFKNMDRDGTLAGVPLGAFPLNPFYVDLTHADGLRFKVDVNGNAEKLNIAISNCATTVFEYFVYDIPLNAVDKNGYMTVPIKLFNKEFWSGNWDLTKPIVFIIEIINITSGTKVSFSDIHAYQLHDTSNGFISLGNLLADGYLDISSSGNVFQEKGSSVEATSHTSINAGGSIILPNNDNSFNESLNLCASYAFISMDSNSITSDSLKCFFNALPTYSLKEVIVNNDSLGSLTDYNLAIKTLNQHFLEVVYTSTEIAFSITGNANICLNEGGLLQTNGNANTYIWLYDGDVISNTSDLIIPTVIDLGSYRCFVMAERTQNDTLYTLSQSVVIHVYAPVTQQEILTICQHELPYSWRDTVFEIGTTSGTVVFNRYTYHGCDSIVYLNLQITPSLPDDIGTIQGDTLIIIGGEFPYIIHSVEGADSYHWVIEMMNAQGNKYVYLDTIIPDTIIKLISPSNDYEIFVKAFNACDTTEISVLKVRLSLSVNEVNSFLLINVYPNPAGDYVSIDNDQLEIKEVKVYDVRGKELKCFTLNDKHIAVDVNDLCQGMYFFHIYTEKGNCIKKVQIIK